MSQNSLYQIVHTLDGRICQLGAHLKILSEAYYEIFNGYLKVDRPLLEVQIKGAMLRSRCPKGVSLFVRIEVDEYGVVTVGESQRSLCKGYTMRTVTPRAVLIEYSMPYIEQPTTLRDSLTQWANQEARRLGGDVALRLHNGRVDLVNGAQIFGISENREVTTAKVSYSVEHNAIKEIIRENGLILHDDEQSISVEALQHFEELFYADHNGITALRVCNNRGYMSVTSNTIADLLCC